ncbi:hypothetical protein PENTCL1PPCAC_20791, partial [Pristionchus entomophagus]
FDMIRLLLLCFIFKLVHSSCTPPLTLVSDGQCRGKVSNSAGIYFDGAAMNEYISVCKGKNAFPISIHNDEQQSYWNKTKLSYTFLIGLICNSGSKQWEWADGSKVDFKPPSGQYDEALDGECKTTCTWWMSKVGAWGKTCEHSYFNADYFCISQLESPPPASTDCGNFNDDSDDSVCYEIAAKAESWKDAQNVCHSFGAEVASVHNLQENNYIRRLAVSRGAINGVLLGATITGKGTDFGWIDGTEWDYSNFHKGFPIDGLGECLSMDTVTIEGQWMNTDCAAKMPVACARPLHDTPEQQGCLDGPWKEGQIIYSPGFPNDSSVPCEFFFTVTAGKKVKLQVMLLEANSCCDYLILTDGYIGGTIIANLTGDANSGKSFTTSSSNVMRVLWQPNGGVNVRGVMMMYSTS